MKTHESIWSLNTGEAMFTKNKKCNTAKPLATAAVKLQHEWWLLEQSQTWHRCGVKFTDKPHVVRVYEIRMESYIQTI